MKNNSHYETTVTELLSTLVDRLGEIEKWQLRTSEHLIDLSNKFVGLETRFDNLETKVDSLSTRFNNLETKVDLIADDVAEIKGTQIRHGDEIQKLLARAEK